jgi:uncharacterized protein (DUF1330 family)
MDVKKGATIIVEGTFNDGYEKYFETYSQNVRDLLRQYDSTVIRRQLITETLYGHDKPNLIMLIDFADKETAKEIFFEDAYLSIIPLRDKVFKTFKMYLADLGNV